MFPPAATPSPDADPSTRPQDSVQTPGRAARLRPLAAYDIGTDGGAAALIDPDGTPRPGATYRWLHLDLADPALPDWADAHLPPLARRTLLADRTRPRLDTEDDGMAITLRGINLNAGAAAADMVSLRIWLTATLVVSVRRQRVFALDDVRAQIDAGDAPRSPGHMLARITDNLVHRLEEVASAREDITDTMEEAVYATNPAPIADLAPLRREIIKFRRHVAPLAETLTQISQSPTDLIRKDLRHRLRETASRSRWALDELSEVHDRLTAMSDHLDTVQNARLERNGYRLSIVAAIFLPLGFLTGLFGVNVGGLPGLQDEKGFLVLCLGMLGIGGMTAAVLRWLRWF
ncbi:zinc transporter [Loktanella fryxellensis]|uniref:Zinc transporter n=1 Tax=Loktanella fryxellensis TaxID=245187 RepID=A0A1H7YIV5_9RHOB|nr:CorA family divalent cation transporter [Loktanella fryxellensis]SEM45237.1 zinc transporter [Loktanella fryxellensis]